MHVDICRVYLLSAQVAYSTDLCMQAGWPLMLSDLISVLTSEAKNIWSFALDSLSLESVKSDCPLLSSLVLWCNMEHKADSSWASLMTRYTDQL